MNLADIAERTYNSSIRKLAAHLFAGTAATTGLLFPTLAYCQVASNPGAGEASSVAPSASKPEMASALAAGESEIVVTAQRRAERAQDVPIAITAFSSQRLRQQNVTNVQDLQASVPSLVIGANGSASRETETPTLRGQGATFQASPGVVMYLNEVPLPAPNTLSQQGGPGNFVDLENMQVLAGPQGTLFGRNTTGGAILLVPHKPTNDLGGSLQVQYGNYDNKQLEAVLNVPVVEDKLLVRVVGAYQDRDGFTRDVVWNKDRDNKHWYSGRLGVTFRPTERVENYLMVYGAYSRTNGTGFINKGFNTEALASFGLCENTPIATSGDFSCDVYRAATAQADALGPRKTAFSIDAFQKTQTWGIHDTLSYEVSDELTLRNIVSYQRFKSSYAADQDATIFQQYEFAALEQPAPGRVTLPGTGTPIVYSNGSPVNRPYDYYKQFTEELQIQGTFLDKNLTVTAGGFYYDQTPVGTLGGSGLTYCPAALTGTAVPGAQPLCIPIINNAEVATRSKALYAQGTLDFGLFTPDLASLRLTGGLRYTWDRVKGVGQAYSPTGTGEFICGTSSALTTDIADCAYEGTLKSKAPTWTVGLDYRVVTNLLLYAKVSRGYKAGGFNANAVFVDTRTFQPEKVTSYEVGFKSDFRIAGVPTRLNTAYYFVRYENIQKSIGDFNPDTNTSGARVVNASADIQGIELEASIRPWKPIEIGGNFSWTDFKYKRYSLPSNGSLPDCSGTIQNVGDPNDLTCLKGNYVSPYIYSFHVSVDLPLARNLGNVALFVNYSHTAAQHTSGVNLPAFEPGQKLEAFGLLNMSLDWNNIAQSGLDAGLFVTNATNKLYRTSNSNIFNTLLSWSTLYGEPRMFGARLRYRFGVE